MAEADPLAVGPDRGQLDPAVQRGGARRDAISLDPEPDVERRGARFAGQRCRGRPGAVETGSRAREAVRRDRIEWTGPAIGAHRAAVQLAPQLEVGLALLDLGLEGEPAHLGPGELRSSQPQRRGPVGEGKCLTAEIGIDLTVHHSNRRRPVQPGRVEIAHLPVEAVHGGRALTHDGRSCQVDQPLVDASRQTGGHQPTGRARGGLDAEIAFGRNAGIDAREVGQGERKRLQLQIEALGDPGIVEGSRQGQPARDGAPVAREAQCVEANLFGRGGTCGGQIEPEGRAAGRSQRRTKRVHGEQDRVAHHQLVPFQGQPPDQRGGVRSELGGEVQAPHGESVNPEVSAGRAGVARRPERVGQVPPIAFPPGGDPRAVHHQQTQAAIGSPELAGVVTDGQGLDQRQLPAAPAQPHVLQPQMGEPITGHTTDLERVPVVEGDEPERPARDPGGHGGHLE